MPGTATYSSFCSEPFPFSAAVRSRPGAAHDKIATPKMAKSLRKAGCDCITNGHHSLRFVQARKHLWDIVQAAWLTKPRHFPETFNDVVNCPVFAKVILC